MTAAIIRADARRLPLPDTSVDLIVTSPPYYALRSYQDDGQHYARQIGAEPTPGEYLDALLACTREWIRVLKPEGSLWVNLGDKYSQRTATRRSSHQDGLHPDRSGVAKNWQRDRAAGRARMPRENTIDDTGRYVPEKSLIGLPWRYAIRCVDNLGLILRAEIIWSKPNGLPESVTDRVRRSHEQWFHFTKQPRYYAVLDEIREPHIAPNRNHGAKAMAGRNINLPRTTTGAYSGPNPLGALPGSVWDVATQPLKVPAALAVEHFATFPPNLIRRIVLGWSPSGICTSCGEGRRPLVARERMPDRPGRVQGRSRDALLDGHGPDGRAGNRFKAHVTVTGYACACPEPAAPTRPSVVLDPFGGTGTTALVASVHGRHGISVDMSADYCRLAQWRTTDPAERARALGAPKPPPVPNGQLEIT
ncbi:DNA-methyltransferase [Actinomadura macra]|uniref:DNA-methyltransferase n=1 Tax=Actinomadura macra TaxID=46164 RepID=UPI0008295FC4|nr:site-specific DNA-methyltransferase [Actinomadura macra]